MSFAHVVLAMVDHQQSGQSSGIPCVILTVAHLPGLDVMRTYYRLLFTEPCRTLQLLPPPDRNQLRVWFMYETVYRAAHGRM